MLQQKVLNTTKGYVALVVFMYFVDTGWIRKLYTVLTVTGVGGGQGGKSGEWGNGELKGWMGGHRSCHSARTTTPPSPSDMNTHTPLFFRPPYDNWALTSNRLH